MGDKIEMMRPPIATSFNPPIGSFQAALKDLIDIYSIEGGSNTPDYILAEYLQNCLEIFDKAVRERERFYKKEPANPNHCGK